jgi:hypothetical protein
MLGARVGPWPRELKDAPLRTPQKKFLPVFFCSFMSLRLGNKTHGLDTELDGQLFPPCGAVSEDSAIARAQPAQEPNVVFGKAVRSSALLQRCEVPERWVAVVFIALGNVGHGLQRSTADVLGIQP